MESSRILYPALISEEELISPKQMFVERIDQKRGVALNKLWHRTQPIITNYWYCRCYGAIFNGIIYAVMLWSIPVARRLNNKGYYELRRFAIAPEAPRNTASWMMAQMIPIILKEKPNVTTLISYQDTSLHHGTIYKASGWVPVEQAVGDGVGWGRGWKSRERVGSIAKGDKIRWEKNIKKNASTPLTFGK